MGRYTVKSRLELSYTSDPQEEMFQCNSEDAPELFRVELEIMKLDFPSNLEEIKAETEADPTL